LLVCLIRKVLKKLARLIASFVVAALLLSGCVSGEESCPIRVAGVPLDDEQNVEQSYKIFMDLVAEATGREVEFYQAPDYAAVTEALISGQVDIAQLSAFSYVLATSRNSELEILGISSRNPDEDPGYFSYGIKRVGDESIQTMADLAGKKVCFSDPSSGAGYLWPSKFLVEAGINPDPTTTSDFEPVFAQTFPQVALSVALGDCDAGFMLDIFYDKTLKNSEIVDMSQLDKFWTSTVSPGIPLVMNPSGLSEREVRSLQEMIRSKANKDQLVAAGTCDDRASCDFLSDAAWGYVEGEDDFYDELRDLCNLLDLTQCKE
jgi:phosphonate transport system substrate-binding protein